MVRWTSVRQRKEKVAVCRKSSNDANLKWAVIGVSAGVRSRTSDHDTGVQKPGDHLHLPPRRNNLDRETGYIRLVCIQQDGHICLLSLDRLHIAADSPLRRTHV